MSHGIPRTDSASGCRAARGRLQLTRRVAKRLRDVRLEPLENRPAMAADVQLELIAAEHHLFRRLPPRGARAEVPRVDRSAERLVRLRRTPRQHDLGDVLDRREPASGSELGQLAPVVAKPRVEGAHERIRRHERAIQVAADDRLQVDDLVGQDAAPSMGPASTPAGYEISKRHGHG